MSKQGRRSPSRNDRRKRRRTREAAPTQRATTASAASATPESPEVKGQGRSPCVQIMAPQEDWELRDTDRETVDSGSADDSEDEDYSDTSAPQERRPTAFPETGQADEGHGAQRCERKPPSSR